MDLWTVAARGDARGIERCLAEGQSPNLPNGRGETPLLVAAGRGSEEAVRKLLEHGAHPDATDRQGRTALMRAAEMGFDGVAGLLVASGAEVRKADRCGERALGIALKDFLGQGPGCSETAYLIARRYPPDALREELRRHVLEGGDASEKDRVDTISSVKESVASLRGTGLPRGLDVSESERLRMFLEDVGRYDLEARGLRVLGQSLLQRIERDAFSKDLLDEIRLYRRKARSLVTTSTQLRMEHVVLERLIGP